MLVYKCKVCLKKFVPYSFLSKNYFDNINLEDDKKIESTEGLPGFKRYGYWIKNINAVVNYWFFSVIKVKSPENLAHQSLFA